MQSLRTFFMESWLENNRFTAKYNLGESGGRPRTVSDILFKSQLQEHEISKKFFSLLLNDSPNWGRLDLREIVAQFHPGATAENVLITTGTSEALFLLFHVLKPKTLALATPGFQLLYEIPEAFGAEIISLPVVWNEEGKPFIDQNEWLNILETKQPECVLINNPHNPSGLIFEKEFLHSIKSLVAKWGGSLIGDEHYRFLASETESLGHTIYENSPNTYVTGSFIKCLGTPGLRIGWCVGDPKILALMQNEKNYTTHTVSPIIEWIAFEILKNIHSDLFQEVKREWITNKKILADFLKSSTNIYGVAPEGGLVTSLGFKTPQSIDPTMSLIQCLNDNGLFVLPLSAMEFGNFEFQQSSHYLNTQLSNINKGFGFRLGLGIESEHFKHALSLLDK